MAHYEWRTRKNGTRQFVRVADEAPAPAVEPETEPDAAEQAEALDPTTLNKAELVAHAEGLGIDASGTKADILARLDASHG